MQQFRLDLTPPQRRRDSPQLLMLSGIGPGDVLARHDIGIANESLVSQAIPAVGQQDRPFRPASTYRNRRHGASSDHLILKPDRYELSVGACGIFQLNYSSLLRAMKSPFVIKVMSKHRADERVLTRTVLAV